MKREIKFRVWDKKPNAMINMEYAMQSNYLKDAIIGKYPIMQFIGLKDKNDIEIYEKDIIDIGQTVNGQSEFVINSIFPLDIRYNYDRSRKYEYDMLELLDIGQEDTQIEVIGNIYQTP